MPIKSVSRILVVAFAACLFAAQTMMVRNVEAGASPTNDWMQLQGPEASRTVGDYVSADDTLNTFYRFFIEVPPGLATLSVGLFDADVSDTGTTEWDRVRNDFETRCRYQLITPAGAVQQTIVTANDGTLAAANNAWLNFTNVANPAAGHWELRITMENPGGAGVDADDLNAIGIRANDGNAGAGGTELPVYAHSFIETGTSNDPVGTAGDVAYQYYPYVTSGCACSYNDWDSDSVAGTPGGNATLTSRSGLFSQTVNPLSGASAWLATSVTGWTNDSRSSDYGIWDMDLNALQSSGAAGGPYNYQTFYFGAFNAAAPVAGSVPSANPEANTFRVYFSTDAGGAPPKPYVQQTLLHLSGPNPPAVGMTSRFLVTIGVVNPTTRPIVFSSLAGSGNRVIANIPGSGVVSTDIRTATQGATSGPGVGATGNVNWGPGTINANSSASMTYSVDVTPPAAGRRVVTGTPASNGTTATYVDETGNTTQARATYTFGPMCELAVTTGTLALTLAEVREYEAAEYPEGTLVRWRSEYEIDNLGYTVYRDVRGQRTKITPAMVSGSALMLGQGKTLASGFDYSWWDGSDFEPGTTYWIEAVDMKGQTTLHGPVVPRAAYGPAPAFKHSSTFGDATAGARQTAAPAGTTQAFSPAYRGKTGTAPGGGAGQPPSSATAAGAKFDINTPGWYRVTKADLQAAGIDLTGVAPGPGPRQPQLYVSGRQIPIKVSADGNTIEFYSTGIDTRTTDVLPATLVAGGGQALRVPVIPWRPGSPSGEGFAREVVRKDRTLYVPALKNGDAENWFGPVVAGGVTDQTLDLGRVLTSFTGTAKLDVTLHGASTDPGSSPDHRVQVSVNGQPAGVAEFDGQTQHTASFTIPHQWLVDGENAITLQAIGTAPDVSLAVSTKLTYQHRYAALDNALTFTVPAGQTATLTGFTSPNIRVVDITNLTSVREFVPDVTAADGGGFTAAVNPIAPSTRVLMAFVDEAVPLPPRISAARPSSLKATTNAADLVIVSHGAFLPAAEQLATLRRDQGLRVSVVDVEDVYDEFSFGIKDPAAIRAFLKHAATSWSGKPAYALLLGDGSVDPRNYLGLGQSDYLPAYLFEASVNEAASDDWFVDFDLDGIPELAVGRLPARTAEDAAAMVNKLAAYDAEAPGAWSNKVLLATDSNDVFDFEGTSMRLEQALPVTIERETAYRDQIGTDAARQRILNAFGEGRLIANYVGHGSVDRWSAAGLLLGSDTAGFANGGRLPLTVSMNCLNGFFQDIVANCLGESLLKTPGGGAVGVWAPSGVSTPAAQAELNQEAMRQFFSGGGTIGDAIRRAKAATGDLDVRRSWILLGDPSMRLKQPAAGGGNGGPE